MSIGFVFWLLMVLWLIFGFYWHWPSEGGSNVKVAWFGGNLLLFILLFLLGWRCFGFPIQG